MKYMKIFAFLEEGISFSLLCKIAYYGIADKRIDKKNRILQNRLQSIDHFFVFF